MEELLIVLVYIGIIGGEPSKIWVVQQNMEVCLERMESLSQITEIVGPMVAGNPTMMDVALKSATCKRMTEEEFLSVE